MAKTLFSRLILAFSLFSLLFRANYWRFVACLRGTASPLCKNLIVFFLLIEYNPEFVKNGGKVSLIGHSLGSVICYDILRNYRTMDDFVANLQNEVANILI